MLNEYPVIKSKENRKIIIEVFYFHQVYTRSVIDPLPAPEGDASKAADRQKKKGGKMTDEEIMEKLSMSNTGNASSQAKLFLAPVDLNWPFFFFFFYS